MVRVGKSRKGRGGVSICSFYSPLVLCTRFVITAALLIHSANRVSKTVDWIVITPESLINLIWL